MEGPATSRGRIGRRMSSVLKKLMATAARSSTSVVKSYDDSPYPVEISQDGSVAVDPNKLVDSQEARRHIAAVRELHTLLEKRK